MEAERALRSIRGGDVRKEEEEERKRAKGAADTAVWAPNWHFCPPFLNLKSF
jgi:hypothetical protein